MTARRVTLIPGDSIGPEITEAVLRVLDAEGVAIEWDEQLAGVAAFEQDGTPLPEATVESFGQTGVAPDIAGKGVANPSALLLAACLMLDYLDETAAADRIRGALEATLLEGAVRTPDLNGNATTTEFANAVLGRLG